MADISRAELDYLSSQSVLGDAIPTQMQTIRMVMEIARSRAAHEEMRRLIPALEAFAACGALIYPSSARAAAGIVAAWRMAEGK